MRIGTRGSALALAQASHVAERLAIEAGDEEIVELVTITTSGDRGDDASPQALAENAPADKSRWVDTIEAALLADEIDLAVHSAKDVPGELAEGLTLLGAPVRVAVVYESAWPSPGAWSAPPSLRAGVSAYLFESDPAQLAPYALAAAERGAVIIPAVDASKSGLSDAEIKNMVADAESHAEDDRRARELAEARNNGENAAYQAERQLKELGDSVDDSSRQDIEAAIAAVREVLEGDDPAPIRARTDALNESFHKVSEAMYERAQQAAGENGSSSNGSATDGDSSSEEDVVDAEVVDEPSA